MNGAVHGPEVLHASTPSRSCASVLRLVLIFDAAALAAALSDAFSNVISPACDPPPRPALVQSLAAGGWRRRSSRWSSFAQRGRSRMVGKALPSHA